MTRTDAFVLGPRLLTRGHDGYAIIRQLRKLRVGIKEVGFLKGDQFVSFANGLRLGLVDECPLAAQLSEPVRVEQRSLYYNTGICSIHPDVVMDYPYLYQWEILTLMHA